MVQKKYYENNYGGVHGEDAVTPIGRAAFIYLAKPNVKFDPPKYGITILFDKKDEKAKELLRKIQTMCQEMALQLFKSKDKMPNFSEQPIFRDGDKEKYEGFAGNWYIVAKNEKRSGFQILEDQLPEAFEAGMLVRAQVQPYVDKKGFSYKLKGIRLVKDDGTRFSVAPDGTSLLRAMDDAAEAVKIKDSTGAEDSLEQSYDNAVAGKASAKSAEPDGLDVL